MVKAKNSLADLKALRKSFGETQTEFWSRFGVSQSGGSRYENLRRVDPSLKMLMQAWLDGLLDDAALKKLKAKIS